MQRISLFFLAAMTAMVLCLGAPALSVSALAQAPENGSDGIHMASFTITSGAPSLHGAVYAEAEGLRMVGIVPDRESADNGLTWTACEPQPDFTAGLPYGYRRNPITAAVDANTNRLITIVNSLDTPGLDPNHSEPAIALREYYLRYRVSEDGGRTWLFDEPIVHQGDYTQKHPFEGIEIGSNCYFLGDNGDIPIVTSSGRILVPIQATMLDDDGNLWNPTGQTTFTDVFVARGTWNEQGKLDWTASHRVGVDPSLSTRGMIEPTLAQFADGRILMVMRGSNAGTPSLPGYRWFSISDDDGENWTDPAPWTYDDGQLFFSPSSMSTLIKHSNGRVFWTGNISPENSYGNNPRCPLVMGEVDPNSLTLIRDSVVEVYNKRPQDLGRGDVQMSHFWVNEDRRTEQLVLTYTRTYTSYPGVRVTARIAMGPPPPRESKRSVNAVPN